MSRERPKRHGQAEELNLVPIMNMVAMLIPFLLMAAQFVEFAVIDSTLPALGPPIAAGSAAADETLALSVRVTDTGYTVAGTATVLGGSAGTALPCVPPGCATVDAYDTRGLTSLLSRVKDEFPAEERVVIVPHGDIPYEVLIVTMDAAREERAAAVGGEARRLFPNVVLSGGRR